MFFAAYATRRHQCEFGEAACVTRLIVRRRCLRVRRALLEALPITRHARQLTTRQWRPSAAAIEIASTQTGRLRRGLNRLNGSVNDATSLLELSSSQKPWDSAIAKGFGHWTSSELLKRKDRHSTGIRAHSDRRRRRADEWYVRKTHTSCVEKRDFALESRVNCRLNLLHQPSVRKYRAYTDVNY